MFFQNISMTSEKDLVLNNISYHCSKNRKDIQINVKSLVLYEHITLKRLIVWIMTALIEKLNGYGFSLPDLRLIHDYLLNKKQRTKINNSYSTWMEFFLEYPRDQYLVQFR